jgi:hypothetical protein
MQERMQWMIRWSAWLCLSLMIWTAAAESTHNHARRAESATCSICVVAHSASPAASSSYSRPVFTAVGLLQEEDVIAQAWLDALDLGIRGPPVV